ncbi:MAG: putative zinc-binding protein [Promethearchaeota archaeon]
MQKKVVILPCSGIGKVFGTVGRHATYIVVNKLRPETTTTFCLPLLQIGDKEALGLAENNFVISIDGCAKACSLKDIERSTGRTSDASVTVMDVFKKNKKLVTREVTFLDEKGKELAMKVAERVAEKVDKLLYGYSRGDSGNA